MNKKMLVKFFFRVAVFTALTLGFCFLMEALVAPRIRNSNVYVAATIEKENRLAELPSPRLVFVGGSNLAFGLDSKKISDSLNIPVVNMGLYAGLGVAFGPNEVKEQLRKGDKVVLSIEYGLTRKGDSKMYAQLIDVNPKAARFLDNSFGDRLKLMDINWQRCVSSLFFAALRSPDEAIYRRDGFSKEGDLLAHLDQPEPKNKTNKGKILYRDYSDEINALNDFVAYAKNKGADVYYTYPTYMASEYHLNKEVIAQYDAQFQKQLTCPIINTPESFVFPDTDYFDNVYHLNRAGRAKRTQVMINILRDKVLSPK